MIRITVQDSQSGTIVRIDGRMDREDLQEVKQVRASLTGSVSLNLEGLITCPPEGLRELRLWLDDGAHLQDANLYMRLLLEPTAGVSETNSGNDL